MTTSSWIDQKIISDLVRETASRTVSARRCHALGAPQSGAAGTRIQPPLRGNRICRTFLHALDEANLSMESLADGLQRYWLSWYRIDQLYLQVHLPCPHVGAGDADGNPERADRNLYSNSYLLKLRCLPGFCGGGVQVGAFPLHTQKEFFEQPGASLRGRRTRCA